MFELTVCWSDESTRENIYLKPDLVPGNIHPRGCADVDRGQAVGHVLPNHEGQMGALHHWSCCYSVDTPRLRSLCGRRPHRWVLRGLFSSSSSQKTDPAQQRIQYSIKMVDEATCPCPSFSRILPTVFFSSVVEYSMGRNKLGSIAPMRVMEEGVPPQATSWLSPESPTTGTIISHSARDRRVQHASFAVV